MRFYVSGPVVKELDDKSLVGAIYVTIKKELSAHQVDLPIRSSELDKLEAGDFYKKIVNLIKSADGVLTVLSSDDQSIPVESSIASMMDKPQSIMEISKDAPRLIRGQPRVVETVRIDTKELRPQVRRLIENLLKNIG